MNTNWNIKTLLDNVEQGSDSWKNLVKNGCLTGLFDGFEVEIRNKYAGTWLRSPGPSKERLDSWQGEATDFCKYWLLFDRASGKYRLKNSSNRWVFASDKGKGRCATTDKESSFKTLFSMKVTDDHYIQLVAHTEKHNDRAVCLKKSGAAYVVRQTGITSESDEEDSYPAWDINVVSVPDNFEVSVRELEYNDPTVNTPGTTDLGSACLNVDNTNGVTPITQKYSLSRELTKEASMTLEKSWHFGVEFSIGYKPPTTGGVTMSLTFKYDISGSTSRTSTTSETTKVSIETAVNVPMGKREKVFICVDRTSAETTFTAKLELTFPDAGGSDPTTVQLPIGGKVYFEDYTNIRVMKEDSNGEDIDE